MMHSLTVRAVQSLAGRWTIVMVDEANASTGADREVNVNTRAALLQ